MTTHRPHTPSLRERPRRRPPDIAAAVKSVAYGAWFRISQQSPLSAEPAGMAVNGLFLQVILHGRYRTAPVGPRFMT
jgi:hypothetical protein